MATNTSSTIGVPTSFKQLLAATIVWLAASIALVAYYKIIIPCTIIIALVVGKRCS